MTGTEKEKAKKDRRLRSTSRGGRNRRQRSGKGQIMVDRAEQGRKQSREEGKEGKRAERERGQIREEGRQGKRADKGRGQIREDGR